MVHVAGAADAFELDALFHQVFVDVEQAAAGKDLLELVLLQLIHAGPAGDDDRLDVEIIQGVGNPVEEHPVVGGDLLSFVLKAGRGLRIAAAQIAGRQHGGGANVVKHRLGGQPDLAEQPLRAAAREIKDRVMLFGAALWIADHRNDLVVFDIEQGAAGAFGQIAGHRFVDEMHHLGLDRRASQGGRRRLELTLDQSQ